MKKFFPSIPVLFLGLFISSCEFTQKIEEKMGQMNRMESVAYSLARENRELMFKISSLNYDIQKLKAKNSYLGLKLNKCQKNPRTSKTKYSKKDFQTSNPHISRQFTRFDTYKWGPEKLLMLANDAFAKKDFTRSAHFFNTFINEFPKNKALNDEILFQAGLSAFQTKKFYDWTVEHMSHLIGKYPASKYFRGAKLWRALAEYKKGNKDHFFNIVEEFRSKYRNTPEWEILSAYYESFRKKRKR